MSTTIQSIMQGRPTAREVQAIVALFETKRAGDLLPHEVLETLARAEPGSARYRTVIGAARRRILREHGVELMTVRGLGYKVPTGDEQLRQSAGHLRRGVKRIGYGARVADAIADHRLDTQGRARRDHIVQRIAYLAAMGKVERKELEMELGKTETLPR